MASDTIRNQCYCDPSFAAIAYNYSLTESKCSTFKDACWGYSLATLILFAVIGLYAFLCFVISLRNTVHRKRDINCANIFSTRNVVFILVLANSVARWIRYLILILNPDTILNNKPLLIVLDILYPTAAIFGFLAIVFLLFVWIRFYRRFLNNKPNRLLAKFPQIFGTANIIGAFIFSLIFVLETAFESKYGHTPSSIFAVVGIIPQTVIFLVYGRKITNTIKQFTAVVVQDLEKFRRLNWFTNTVMVWFAISWIVSIIGSLISLWDKSLTSFLVRHIVFRICESAYLIILTRALSPSFFGCGFLAVAQSLEASPSGSTRVKKSAESSRFDSVESISMN